jgi:hypothetical protein
MSRSANDDAHNSSDEERSEITALIWPRLLMAFVSPPHQQRIGALLQRLEQRIEDEGRERGIANAETGARSTRPKAHHAGNASTGWTAAASWANHGWNDQWRNADQEHHESQLNSSNWTDWTHSSPEQRRTFKQQHLNPRLASPSWSSGQRWTPTQSYNGPLRAKPIPHTPPPRPYAFIGRALGLFIL